MCVSYISQTVRNSNNKNKKIFLWDDSQLHFKHSKFVNLQVSFDEKKYDDTTFELKT